MPHVRWHLVVYTTSYAYETRYRLQWWHQQCDRHWKPWRLYKREGRVENRVEQEACCSVTLSCINNQLGSYPVYVRTVKFQCTHVQWHLARAYAMHDIEFSTYTTHTNVQVLPSKRFASVHSLVSNSVAPKSHRWLQQLRRVVLCSHLLIAH